MTHCVYCGEPIQPLVYGRPNKTCRSHKDLPEIDPFFLPKLQQWWADRFTMDEIRYLASHLY